MICKDTIEEKILMLQKRKKELSDHLIGDNKGFVKQLTKEAVEYLFS
jgi:SNF2 family DNA or RNA helicase